MGKESERRRFFAAPEKHLKGAPIVNFF